jgi:BlaI family transcriptional regulator, penicillinase repressor
MSYCLGMNHNRPPKPTAAELELLSVLWNRGPSTVREIHEALSSEKETGYTTTLKILQKMTDKGLVTRDESQRSHVYQAALGAEKTQRQLVHELLEKAFGGAADKLIQHALSSRKVSRDEIDTLRQLLDELEEKSR